MARHPNFGLIAAFFALVGSSLTAPSAVAGPIWQNDWTYQAPPVLAPFSGSTEVSFATNGDLIVSGVDAQKQEFQVTRIGNDGALRWSANLDWGLAGYYSGASVVLATDDGGALLSLGEGYEPKIARVDGSGNLLWMRNILARVMSPLQGGLIAARNCSEVFVFDGASGALVWKREVPSVSSCASNQLLVDDASNLYVSYVEASDLHSIKLAPDGTVIWNVVSGPTSGQLVSEAGIADNDFYLRVGSDLRSYRQSDGSLSWTADIGFGGNVTVSRDSTAEPIVITDTAIRRLSADSGAERWSRTFSAITFTSSLEDAIILRDGGNFLKLNAATGATQWSSTLPTSNSDGQALEWHGFGGSANNRLIGVASGNPRFNYALAYLQPFDFSNGSVLAELPVPMVGQGLIATIAASGDRSVSAAFSALPTALQVRVRSVNSTDGTTQWEIAQNLALGLQGFDPVYWPDVAFNGSEVAVVSTHKRPSFPNPPEGGLQVDLFDGATGSLLWSKLLHELSQGGSGTWGPKLDADGNVYVDIDTSVPCGSTRCAYHRLYKFLRLDGSVVWSRDHARANYEIFGNDVVMPGAFGNPSATLSRVSGVDGSDIWSSNELAGDGTSFGLIRLNDQSVNLLGSANNAKIDVSTGATVWSAANQPYNCATPCYINDGIILPGGDLLQVGEGGSLPYIRRVHNDGSGTVEEWHPDGSAPLMRFNLLRLWKAPSGDLHVSIAQTLRSTLVYIGFIAQLDPQSGTLSSFQARTAAPVDSGSSGFYFNVLDAPTENEALFASTRISPTLPTTAGVGLLDTTITTHGDLAVSLTIDDSHPVAGQSLGYHMTASYMGDQALIGAHLIGSLPGRGSDGPISCDVANASNCVVDNRFGGINASFDIQPGGSITIHGELRMLEDADQSWMGVGAYGPTSLGEQDTVNNFARSTIIQSLFRDGFDN